MNKSAKELFEELGYEIVIDNQMYLEYINRDTIPYTYIYFKKDKTIEVYSRFGVSYKVFQAINKQVEELEWI